jgi:hemolysin activation/secretion protein
VSVTLKRLITVGLFGFQVAQGVHAQGTGLPDPAPEIRRQEGRQDELRRQLELAPTVRLPRGAAAAPTRLPESEAICQRIDEIHFEGLPEVAPALERALWGPEANDSPLGRCLGVQAVQVLMDRARNALIAQGYITSRVEAAPQDLSLGRLTLQVVPGRIARIQMAPGSSAAPATRPLSAGEVLNLRDLEQGLENLRRNPGAEVDFQLAPGEQADTTDVQLRYLKPLPLGLNVSLDDTGSRATGKRLGQATLSWYGPLGLNDLAYLNATHAVAPASSRTRGNDSQTLHYSLPWGYWLWSATASRGDYHQTVVGAFQSYLYSGQTQSHDLQLSRVVHRDADSKTSLRLKGFGRGSRNFIDDTEVLVQQRRTAGWEAGLQHAQQWGQVSAELDLAYRRGTGAFGALRAPEELFGEGTSRMQIGTGTLSLQWPASASGRVVFNHFFKLQLNRTPLVAQDRLCLGGRSSVRGFDGVQSLCGDRGLLWRNDLTVPVSDWPLSFYVGLDAGRVGGRSAQELPQRWLSGYALGLRAQHRLPQTTQPTQLYADFFVGRPISRPTFLQTASTTTGFSLSLSF